MCKINIKNKTRLLPYLTAIFGFVFVVTTGNIFSEETIKIKPQSFNKEKEVSSPNFQGFVWTDSFEQSEAGKKYLINNNGKMEINPQYSKELANLPTTTFMTLRLNQEAAKKTNKNEVPIYLTNYSGTAAAAVFTGSKLLYNLKAMGDLSTIGVLSNDPANLIFLTDSAKPGAGDMIIYTKTDGSKQVWEISPGINPPLGGG